MFSHNKTVDDAASWAVIWAGILTLDYFFNPVGFWHAMGVLFG